MIQLNSSNFDEEVASYKGKSVVVFSSDNCPVCKRMEPVLSSVVHEISGVKFCSVNTDASADLAQKFNVRSVPATIVFEKGQEKSRAVGLLGKREIFDMVSKGIVRK